MNPRPRVPLGFAALIVSLFGLAAVLAARAMESAR